MINAICGTFTNASFDDHKKATLEKVDYSRKGSIDVALQDTISMLNGSDDYFTTSSCSGRAVIYSLDDSNRKRGCRWHFVSHDPISETAFYCLVSKDPVPHVPEKDHVVTSCVNELIPGDTLGNVFLKFEPAIIHVKCRNLACAVQLQKIALDAGFKNSGLTIGNGKLTFAIRTTISLEVPLKIQDYEVPREFCLHLLSIVNEKFAANCALITRLEGCLKTHFSNS